MTWACFGTCRLTKVGMIGRKKQPNISRPWLMKQLMVQEAPRQSAGATAARSQPLMKAMSRSHCLQNTGSAQRSLWPAALLATMTHPLSVQDGL